MEKAHKALPLLAHRAKTNVLKCVRQHTAKLPVDPTDEQFDEAIKAGVKEAIDEIGGVSIVLGNDEVQTGIKVASVRIFNEKRAIAFSKLSAIMVHFEIPHEFTKYSDHPDAVVIGIFGGAQYETYRYGNLIIFNAFKDGVFDHGFGWPGGKEVIPEKEEASPDEIAKLMANTYYNYYG